MHYLDANQYLSKTTEYYQKIATKDKEKGKSSFEDIEKTTSELKVFITEIKYPLYTNKNYYIIL